MTESLVVPQGQFVLKRLPARPHELLRAWDAADELLLEHVAEQGLLTAHTRLFIVNDGFGALSVALSSYQPQALSDSYLSQTATRMNLLLNAQAETAVTLLDSLAKPNAPLDVVLIKVPKTIAWLKDILLRIRPYLQPTTQIILAGMLKHLPASTWSLVERIIGPTTSSLAKKKARLIFAQLDDSLIVPANPYPSSYILENTDYLIVNHANVFSRAQLDIGTRFFLAHLPLDPHAEHIVDLGCGNGVVGLMAALKNPQAKVSFADESFMALASARQNFANAFGESRAADFCIGDGLEDFAAQSADLILCNPPFHQQQTIGDHLALNFFQQARRCLRPKGALYVIGNRHLAYQARLQKLFRRCDLIAANQKFLILKAIY